MSGNTFFEGFVKCKQPQLYYFINLFRTQMMFDLSLSELDVKCWIPVIADYNLWGLWIHFNELINAQNIKLKCH